jgi:hypothetical protein
LLLLFIGDLAQQTVKDCLARRAEVDHVAHVANQIAQQRDHAAIAVVEKPDERVYGQTSAVQSLDVRYLARIPLGTPYGCSGFSGMNRCGDSAHWRWTARCGGSGGGDAADRGAGM